MPKKVTKFSKNFFFAINPLKIVKFGNPCMLLIHSCMLRAEKHQELAFKILVVLDDLLLPKDES